MSVARKFDGGLDSFAIGASIACLVHCLLLPILFALLPAASAFLRIPESFHIAAFLLAIPASALAMRSGYRHHGITLPTAFALTDQPSDDSGVPMEGSGGTAEPTSVLDGQGDAATFR